MSREPCLGAVMALVVLTSACGSDAEPTPTGSECPPASTLTYENFGQDFAETYCTRCHDSARTGADRNGAPFAHDFDTVEGIRMVSDHVDEYAAGGPDAVNTIMPPSAPRPTEAERLQLGEWIACGAP